MTVLAIVDTETSGTDPAHDYLVEVACVLWSVEHRCSIAEWADLVKRDANPAEDKNHIPAGALPLGLYVSDVENRLIRFTDRADLILAHNAGFDRSFLPGLSAREWLCTMDDFQWPLPASGRSLVAICVAHGVPVVRAHRALTDCMLIASLLERCAELGYSVEGLIEHARRPKALFVARVSYDDREKAKAAGFRWEGETKRWLRKMAIEDASKLEFKVSEVAA